MRTPEKLIVGILIMLLGALTASAQKVSVGADPAVDVTRYKTYAWATEMVSINPIVSGIVVSSVDSQLAAKGLKKVATDPELTVVVFGSTESDIHVSNPSWAPSLNSIATGVAVGSHSFLITKGTLVVDMLDTKTNNSVWRGQATETLERGPTGDKAKDAKTVEKPIRNAIKKMFKQFPHPSRK
ncbi:MAG TPA: DUF4136 domain-containing protein [Pyrinomonadaceae bacterium]|nr:DUF4136 domain-containing protein [Pyrinomonadaceae bacterium]